MTTGRTPGRLDLPLPAWVFWRLVLSTLLLFFSFCAFRLGPALLNFDHQLPVVEAVVNLDLGEAFRRPDVATSPPGYAVAAAPLVLPS